MKSAHILVLFPLFLIGVFGGEVSVKEGDSVTLRTELTEILKDDGIEWRFNGTRIAKMNNGSKGISTWITSDGKFRDRLQLDSQTGDLKIKDITTTDSGEYQLKLSSTRGSSEKTFSVNGVASANRDAQKTVSVQVGDTVTLNLDTDLQRDDVIRWRFEHQNSPIAEIERKSRNISTPDGPDGRFRDRLKLDYWTGSLTIMNIIKNHSGVYEVDISRSGYTIHKSFSVTVRDKDAVKSVSVMEGDSVTLDTDLTEIQTDEVILWKFRGTGIAEIIKADKQIQTSYALDGRFSGRLKLDNQTGSLTITNTRTTDTGDYEVTISTSKYIIHKRITVTVTDEKKSELVNEGDSITLYTGLTEIQKDDLIEWTFGDTPIAEIPDGRFRNRLKLDPQTGSLTITDTRTKDAGLYKLQISSSRRTIDKRFTVIVMAKSLSVKEGDTVVLKADSEIQRDDQIQWKFGEQVILTARLNGPDAEKTWSNIHLNDHTGDLIITDIRGDQFGVYELLSQNNRPKIRYNVIGSGLSAGAIAGIVVAVLLGFGAVVAAVIFYRRRISELNSLKPQMLWVTEGESVALVPYRTEIREADDIQWKFRGALIAERKAANGEFTIHDERFKDRLQPEKDSGFLTITNTSSDMSGDYELQILRQGHQLLKTFIVSVFAKIGETPMKIVMEGESFTLPSGVTGTQRDDQMQWKFKHEDSPIAQIKGGIPETFPSAAGGRFGDRLTLNKNGSLTITNTKTTDTGVYSLYNTESGDKSITSFNVVVFPKYFKNNPEEEPLMRV